MKKFSFLVILLWWFSFSKEDCSFVSSEKSIECINTSLNEYFYEILKELYSYEFLSDFDSNDLRKVDLNNISVRHSSFDHIRELRNPSEKFPGSVTILEIINSKVQIIEPYAFVNFQNITTLDLSYNKLKDISFTFLLGSLGRLILNNNEIEIENLDLTYYNKASILDLSYNNIKKISVGCRKFSYKIPKSKSIFLNLAYNKIEDIDFSELDCWSENVNLEGNKNFSVTSENMTNLFGIHMSFALQNMQKPLNLRGSHIFNISNNELFYLDKKIFNAGRKNGIVNLTNCFLTKIDKNVFKNVKINRLLLGCNDLKNVTQPMFNLSKIEFLDISNSSIENVDKMFKGLHCKTLILKNNNISKLSLKSFDEIKFVEELDLSFNYLIHLENTSFVNCNGLKTLNISFNNLFSIDILAFYSLQNLETLDLRYNNLNLESGVFSLLKSLKYLNLEHSLYNNYIKPGILNDLPIEILNLKMNNFSCLRENTFYNLPKLTKLSMLNVRNFSSNVLKNLPSLELLEIGQVDNLNFSKSSIQTEIKTLKMNSNDVLILRSQSFLDLVNLQNLAVHKSKVEIEKDAFFGLFHLEYLLFKSTNILKFDRNCLRGLFNLKYLDAKELFTNVKIVKKGLFDNLHFITNLELDYINLTQIENHALVGLKSLENLTLSGNQLNTLLKDSFVGLNNMKILNISFSNIQNIENFTFYDLKSLLVLDLQGNNLKNLYDLKFSMVSLEYVNLENCKISKLSKNVFEHLESLKVLNLRNNLIDQIEDLQVESFAHIPNLTDLNLAGNFIEDFKVGIFSNLRNLKNLDLSNNNITKFLIEAFVPLKSLENLSLDNNHLKTLNVLQFLPYARNLKHVGISQNKLPCDKLTSIIKELRHKNISYRSNQPVFEIDNIEGIECVDVCKFLFCLKDTHGIN